MLLYYLWELIVDLWDIITIDIEDWHRWKRKERQRISFYLSVDADELPNLPDIELFATPYLQLTRKYSIRRVGSLDELNRFNSVQQIFWAVNAYEQMNYKGGILSFLTSEYGYTAPLLPFALESVGATEHLKLLLDFIERNELDLNELSHFSLDGLKRREKADRLVELGERYGVSDFDEEYRKLESIESYMIPYIRENAERLLAEPKNGNGSKRRSRRK